MDTTSKKPKTMAELLPGLSSILSKDSIQTLTAKKQPRQTIVNTRTAEKVLKPLTIAEMRADILALKVRSPRRFAQSAVSTKKKTWNSSVKVDNKTVSHTANGQLKNNSVRKVLNFQAKPKAVPNVRATMMNEPPKFSKPEIRAKKSILLPARNNVRISGITHIAQTPVVNVPNKSRMMLANKENILSNHSNIKIIQPKFFKPKTAPVPDTPCSNESWKSSCDASFLQREKEINDIDENTKPLIEANSIQNTAVTPPVSTPFRNYRCVEDFFHHSSDNDTSVCIDNTIMSFDEPVKTKEKTREETVIVSLCDLLKKASVNQQHTTPKDIVNTELDDLLQIEKRTVNNIVTIENSIAALYTLKESQLASLQSVRKLIKEKNERKYLKTNVTETKEAASVEAGPNLQIKSEISDEQVNKQLPEATSEPLLPEYEDTEEMDITITDTPQKALRKSYSTTSVIKCAVKSPTYKIPKKNLCLRKKVFCKSMPNVSNGSEMVMKSDMGNRALSVYMKMKEHMHFLNTPIAKRSAVIPDTPAMTSQNLQKQLDKLYGE